MKKLSYYLTLMIFCIILSGIKAREKQSNQTKRERMRDIEKSNTI